MIDSPWRLLRMRGYGKFATVRDTDFAVAIGIFGPVKHMIEMTFFLKSAFGKGAERAATIAASSHFAPRSFAAILETMT
jgi:hypothetical protein